MPYIKKKKIPLETFHKRIPVHTVDALKMIAKQKGCTVTDVVRDALDEYIQSDRKSVYGGARRVVDLYNTGVLATDEQWEQAMNILMDALKYK